MRTDYTPYEGIELTGGIDSVLVGGRTVIDHGQLVDGSPRGRALRADPLFVRS